MQVVSTTSLGNCAAPPTLAHFVVYALHRTRLHPLLTFRTLAQLSQGTPTERIRVNNFVRQSYRTADPCTLYRVRTLSDQIAPIGHLSDPCAKVEPGGKPVERVVTVGEGVENILRFSKP